MRKTNKYKGPEERNKWKIDRKKISEISGSMLSQKKKVRVISFANEIPVPGPGMGMRTNTEWALDSTTKRAGVPL